MARHRPNKATRPINKDVLKELKERQKERRSVVREKIERKPEPEPKTKPEQRPRPRPTPKPKHKPEPLEPMPEPILSGNKELLVGSIFIDCTPLQEKWLDLQLKFLRATTKDFDYVAFISDCSPTKYFKERTTIIPCKDGKKVVNSKAHVRGLSSLLEFFKKNPGYKYYLFLDNDAFPIRKDWQKTLVGKMKKEHEIAISLRCENLETRLHSSIIFAKPQALKKMQWHVGQIGDDLCGKKESDVRLSPYQQDRKTALPMIKSNQWNRHPLLCAVYHDLFYHHCCGSGRKYNMRSKPYWGHIVPQQTNVMETIDELMADPTGFISKLAGWNPQHYPKVI